MSSIIMDELIVTFRVLEQTPEIEAEAIRQKLASDEFMHQLQQAIKNVMGMCSELKRIQFSITR